MFLVLVFLSAAGLLFCLEVEFLALSFIIVYVGAIAILFLFVVMMLDIKIGDNSLGSFSYGLLGLSLSFIFSIGIILPLFEGVSVYPYPETSFFDNIKLFLNVGASNTEHTYVSWLNQIDFITNLESIGQILYTYYFVFFLMSGFILFVAMTGALMLTLTLKKSVKKQIVYKQLSRHEENAFLNQNK
jgi:NADH-quinone oxidoreductase subunit J|tara:strand:- start:849 stop:1409 length:561 start_codon:yes stop_codon:yes gene_type:complete